MVPNYIARGAKKSNWNTHVCIQKPCQNYYVGQYIYALYGNHDIVSQPMFKRKDPHGHATMLFYFPQKGS